MSNRKALLTTVIQQEVTIIDRDSITSDDERKKYDYNNPNKVTGGKWELILYPSGLKLWTPVHSYTFNTPKIVDHKDVTVNTELLK